MSKDFELDLKKQLENMGFFAFCKKTKLSGCNIKHKHNWYVNNFEIINLKFIKDEQLLKIQELKTFIDNTCNEVSDKQGVSFMLEPLCKIREKFIELFGVKK